jgi:hypothetical protein
VCAEHSGTRSSERTQLHTLQGDMAGERDGVVRGHAKVDAAKAKAK